MCLLTPDYAIQAREDAPTEALLLLMTTFDDDIVDNEENDKNSMAKKQHNITKTKLRLEKTVCESEKLDRILEQQKLEYEANLKLMEEIKCLLKETDEFLAGYEKKMKVCIEKKENRKQQHMIQANELCVMLALPAEEEEYLFEFLADE